MSLMMEPLGFCLPGTGTGVGTGVGTGTGTYGSKIISLLTPASCASWDI
jgi:hypothetical protein